MARPNKTDVSDGIKLPGFPSEELQNNTVGLSGKAALLDAFNFYQEIKRYAAKLHIPLQSNTRVLDFGCGWGRVIRFFFKDLIHTNLYGIDIVPEMINTCVSTVGYGNYSQLNQPNPPTIFSNDSFDIIYAYSVFSHLSEPIHLEWLEEFFRILKPGGMLIVTTRPRRWIDVCKTLRDQPIRNPHQDGLANSFQDHESAFLDYDNGKVLYSPVGGGEVCDASFYGETLIPQTYVEQVWSKHFIFRDFVDDPSIIPQAIIVVQKA